MTPARAGLAFLVIMVLYIGASFLVSLAAWKGGSVTLSFFQSIMLSEGIVLLPGLLIATVCGSEVSEIFRFRKLKISTCLLVVVFIFFIEPLVSVANAVSLLFSENEAMGIANEYMSQDSSFLYIALVMAIIGPVAEEITFRGIIYAGLRRSGRILPAIILQALLFGLMHLNVNQMSYAFVLGVAFGILDEVTNSLWPGIIGHFMINFGSVVASFAMMKYMPEALNMEASRADILYSLSFFAVLALLFTGIAVIILKLIAKNEPGGRFRLHRIFHARDLKVITRDGAAVIVKRPAVFTIPLIIGMIIAVTEIVITAFLKM